MMKLGTMAEAFDLLASSSSSLNGLKLHQERFRSAVRGEKENHRKGCKALKDFSNFSDSFWKGLTAGL